MRKLKFFTKTCISTYKVGEYEFLTKVNFIPLFMLSKIARVRVELIQTKASTDCWNKSAFVRRSNSRIVVKMFISSYLEKVDYFKETLI
jgi:hypothetical protein